MLLVRDLTKMAWFREVDAFVRFLGPIALMQEPTAADGGKPRRKDRVAATVPLTPQSPEQLPKLGPFGGLAVAMLPTPSPDGTVQLVIGRDPACTLVIEDPAVSANHAALRWDGKQGIVVDLASANGTFVNQKRLRRSATLTSGDQLRFGRSTFVYLLVADLHARLRRFKPD